MQADKRTLSEILSPDIRFVAPLFQRPYVWNQVENWEPLWNALSEVVNRRLNGKNPRPYFMGAIVLDKLHGSTGTVPSREIIDGQQRMTTLQILMEVAKQIFAQRGLDHPARLLERVTRNELEIANDHQFKVWPTNIDRDAFRQVMTGSTAQGRFAEAAGFFRDSVLTWLGPNDELAKERANAFVSALRQDLVFVAIDLDNDDDGQLIFETLNSLGTPLLPSDLVKNLLFRQAAADGLDTEKLYHQHWHQFESDSDYWRGKVSVGRRERHRLDLFLQYYLTFRLGSESVVAHQFRDYRDAFQDGLFGSTEDAIADFTKHAALFKEFDQSKTGAAGNLRHVLDILDATVPNPLILGIYANTQPGSERDSMLETIESYLIRRFLCCVSTKNYNRITADLIVKLNSSAWTNAELQTALLQYEGNSSVWPDDGFIVWRQTERSAYGDLRGVGIAYVLSRVEQSLRGGKSEHGWNVRTPLTIEHIMPQKWRENWPVPDPDDSEAEARREALIDHIGNLTVLTRKLNSSISNGSWQTKRGHLNDHTVLLMNSALAQRATWEERAIMERSRDLAQQFCELWPRPKGSEAKSH